MRHLIIFLLVALGCLLAAPTNQKANDGSTAKEFAEKAVTISNFQFTPKVMTIKAGETVTWTDKEGTHTVTADDNSWESPTLNAGKTFSHQFPKPGTYPYHCSFHGSPGGDMSGRVRVVR